jgi:hypothetical protein
MAYNSSYGTADLTSASIDGVAIFIITLIGFAGIVALIFVGKWAMKSFKK